ncbi:ISKra4 family transposase [Ktedonobacter sp. SOSP1-52]|uniref:ISKra4 family transposase n=1 Tax=Ktedonobacter sp. SOSP1-52 TaxID=2778366 RepID=UPI0019167686|nr:ISKra4 family transposase [Ktedonobacter sp. SOSP1-52]
MEENASSWSEPTDGVPCAGTVFFPLDEELGLLPGTLAPRQQEHLVHLASWMPFEQASGMLTTLLGVKCSAETARRLTERMGACMEAAQTAEAEMTAASEPAALADQLPPQRCVLSTDGTMVSLLHKQWVEVRTLAIGQPQERRGTAGEAEIHVDQLSYFSRLADASSFTCLAQAEIRRRRVGEAQHVCAVTDGADWCQAFIQRHRPDAVRILDFPHAVEHITHLLEAVKDAGMSIPSQMLERCLHVLKHRGPHPLLLMANHLGSDLIQQKGIQEHLDYLRKRESLMQYPAFRARGWPIGSGMVESANKLVVQARLKGSGMHWQRQHVNPMLALRNAVCNERWQEMWGKALTQAHTQKESHGESQPQPRSLLFRRRDRSCLSAPSSPSPLSSAAPQEIAPLASSSLATSPVLASPDAYLPSTERSCHPRRSHTASSSRHLGRETCPCGTPLKRMRGHRPKQYCSGRCRQRAYRSRKAQARRSSAPLTPMFPIPRSGPTRPWKRHQQKRGANDAPKRAKRSFHRSGGVKGKTCLFCGAELVQSCGRQRGGRQKAYCSGRCRQRAYRERTA